MNQISQINQMLTTKSAAPLIGIPTWSDSSVFFNGVDLYALNQSYINAISVAGGVPFMVPLNIDFELLWNLFCKLDGLFLAGGTDIFPELYGESVDGSEGRFDHDRDLYELVMTRWALQHDLPILGVCRGMQMINVAAGGTLYHNLATDLPDVNKHDFFATGADRKTIQHSIFIERDSYLGETLGEIAGVNSMHHQAVKEIGCGLQVTAISEDGLIEGIEGIDHKFVLGCQWHPEEMSFDPRQRQLFLDFTFNSAVLMSDR